MGEATFKKLRARRMQPVAVVKNDSGINSNRNSLVSS